MWIIQIVFISFFAYAFNRLQNYFWWRVFIRYFFGVRRRGGGVFEVHGNWQCLMFGQWKREKREFVCFVSLIFSFHKSSPMLLLWIERNVNFMQTLIITWRVCSLFRCVERGGLCSQAGKWICWIWCWQCNWYVWMTCTLTRSRLRCYWCISIIEILLEEKKK